MLQRVRLHGVLCVVAQTAAVAYSQCCHKGCRQHTKEDCAAAWRVVLLHGVLCCIQLQALLPASATGMWTVAVPSAADAAGAQHHLCSAADVHTPASSPPLIFWKLALLVLTMSGRCEMNSRLQTFLSLILFSVDSLRHISNIALHSASDSMCLPLSDCCWPLCWSDWPANASDSERRRAWERLQHRHAACV